MAKALVPGRGWISSLAAKMTLILVALGAVSALLGAVSMLVFSRVTDDMNTLTTDDLAGLEQGAALIEATDAAKNAMIGMLTLRDAAALDDRAADVDSAVARLTEAAAALPSQSRGLVEDDVADASRTLAELVADRRLQFENEASVEAKIDELRERGSALTAATTEMADTAYFDLSLGGENTIAAIDATLSVLVEEQFAAMQTLLEARAEINLLSGALLSARLSNDVSTRSILSDLAIAARDRLNAAIDGLAENPHAETVLPPIREAAQALTAIVDAETRRTAASEILGLRRDADVALSSAIDDMVFELMIAAEEASSENRAAIESLLENEVGRINTLFAIGGAIIRFQEAALDVVIASDAAEVSLGQPPLEHAADALLSHRGFADGALDEALDGLATLADPETGLTAFKTAALRADEAAAKAIAQTTAAVLQIGELASELGARNRADIASMATGIEAEVASASDRLNLLLGVQAAGVIAALILTRVLVQRPLHRVSRTTERLASGDLAEVEGFARSSLEIRRIADALSVFRDGLIEKREMEARQEAERAARMAEQQAAVTAIGNALERLSKGDLSQSIDDDMAEGYDKLRDDFNHAQANLRTMLEELSSASAEILASARQLATGSDDLAGRTENQAATLEESVAALDEVTSNVNESARHAQEVRGNLDTAQSDAESSGAVVRDAMEAMQAIKDGSDKISNIIGVIDDIAFQTNLLALNAGVEAARAGAAGRGFAVVAEEVRGLAQRSSESAMEIKALIGDSATQVDRGVDLVGNAGNALIAILEQFKAASGMVAGIARSANEQALSLKEVNTAMTSLDSVTQENAAMVQDSTAATSRLNAEAMRLAELASNFSTGTKSSATHVAGDAAENGPDREVA